MSIEQIKTILERTEKRGNRMHYEAKDRYTIGKLLDDLQSEKTMPEISEATGLSKSTAEKILSDYRKAPKDPETIPMFETQKTQDVKTSPTIKQQSTNNVKKLKRQDAKTSMERKRLTIYLSNRDNKLLRYMAAFFECDNSKIVADALNQYYNEMKKNETKLNDLENLIKI